jgi:hypothetical protein
LRCYPLGLLVCVRLDIPAVGCDGNEPGVRAIIVEPLDEFTVAFGVSVGKGRMWHLRIERTAKLVARTESLPAMFAHANDFGRILWAHLADRVEPVLVVVALDPNLMPELPPDRRDHFGVGRACSLWSMRSFCSGSKAFLIDASLVAMRQPVTHSWEGWITSDGDGMLGACTASMPDPQIKEKLY